MTPWHYPPFPPMLDPPRSPLDGSADPDRGRCFLVTSMPQTPWSHLFEADATDAVLAAFNEREPLPLQIVEVVEWRDRVEPPPDAPGFNPESLQRWLDGFWAAEATVQRAHLRQPNLDEHEWHVAYAYTPLGDEGGGENLGELFFAPEEEMARRLLDAYHQRVGGPVLLGRLRRVDPRYRSASPGS